MTGSLAAGLLIGQLGHVPVSGTAKPILFLMFIFGIAGIGTSIRDSRQACSPEA